LRRILRGGDLGRIDRYLYYRDLALGETDAGSEIACGSLLTGWERLSRGNHRFEPIMIALPGAHDADALVKELNTAPVVGVRAARNQRRVSRAPHRHGSVSRAAARDSSEAGDSDTIAHDFGLLELGSDRRPGS